MIDFIVIKLNVEKVVILQKNTVLNYIHVYICINYQPGQGVVGNYSAYRKTDFFRQNNCAAKIFEINLMSSLSEW